MAETKTKVTDVKAKDFVGAVENETRRADGEALLKLFAKATGWKPQMWGPTIVGYGRYHYVYDSGHEGDMCVTGFSPRKANLVIYPGPAENRDKLLKQLGKHKSGGGGCIYINKLADVDTAVLEKLIKDGVAGMKKKWQVTAA